MNVAVIRTKAEQAIPEHFEAALPGLPGGPEIKALRKSAFGAFSATGLPHRRVEAWKYTDLRARIAEAFPPAIGGGRLDEKRLAEALGTPLSRLQAVSFVFVNGALASWSHGPLVADDPRLRFEALGKALSGRVADLTKRLGAIATAEHDPVTALNTAFATDGAVISIAKGARLEVPIHLVFLSDAEAPLAIATRNLIEIGDGAAATILESHVGAGSAARQSTSVAEISVADGAKLDHIRLVSEGGAAAHLATTAVRLGRDVTYSAFHLTESTALVRNQLFVTFAGEGSELTFGGATLGRGKEHVDTTLVVDHAVPRCTSRELYKAVLDGESRGVFQGKVIVRPGAQKTDGKQMARALLLSPAAEFDSKPELEIYADDVVCGHGSTSGEIDEDMLFYLCARGIPAPEARAMLVEAFIAEAFDGIADEAIRAALRQRASHWLKRRSA